MTSERLRRRQVILFLTCGAAIMIGGVYLVVSIRMPEDAPLARMYRTEADLVALRKAIDTYHQTYGVYPRAGAGGLRRATDFLSRNAAYFPQGPPLDGWGRPFHYVPFTQYQDPTAGALSSNGDYHAPNTYQLYSLGADGEAGLHTSDSQLDNITSWDSRKPWRNVYGKLQETYLMGKGKR